MNKKTLLSLLFISSLGLLVSCVSKKEFESLQSENQELKSSLASVEERVDELQMQNDELSSQNDELNSELDRVAGKLESTEGKVAQIQKDANQKQRELDALMKEVKAAFADIEDATSTTDARVKQIEDALYIDMNDTINFRTASATISPNDKETLDRLAKLLKEHPNLHLVVEGNADKRSINNENYKDNWELSAARSIAVVRKLVNMGVDPTQLTAAGRAEHNPSVTTDPDSRETLAANRRIELMVLPKIGTLYQMSKN